MKPKHLSETELQQYAFDADCNAGIVEHIGLCELCKAKVTNYRLLFLEVQQQPKPVFDFDMAQLVLARLPKRTPAFAWSDRLIYTLVCTLFGLIGIPLYILWKDIVKTFRDVEVTALYLVLFSTILIMVFQAVEMYRRYKKQLNTV